MAEFCLECFNKLNGTAFTRGDVIQAYDFCENCGTYKKCIVELRGHGPVDALIRLCIDLLPETDSEA